MIKDKNSHMGNKKVNSILYDEETNVVIFSFGNKIYFVSGENY